MFHFSIFNFIRPCNTAVVERRKGKKEKGKWVKIWARSKCLWWRKRTLYSTQTMAVELRRLSWGSWCGLTLYSTQTLTQTSTPPFPFEGACIFFPSHKSLNRTDLCLIAPNTEALNALYLSSTSNRVLGFWS